jgi:hypothetical protein
MPVWPIPQSRPGSRSWAAPSFLVHPPISEGSLSTKSTNGARSSDSQAPSRSNTAQDTRANSLRPIAQADESRRWVSPSARDKDEAFQRIRFNSQPPGVPRVRTNTAYIEWLAAINRRLRLNPPKQTFAQRSGRSILPMGWPTELKIITPSLPGPPPQPHHKFPSRSTRKPSAMPPRPTVMNVRPLVSLVPSSTTS